MTYILMIWTVVGFAGAGTQYSRDFKTERDWRPLGEFHSNGHGESNANVLAKCEAAARQLGLKLENYQCVRAR